VVVSAVPTLGFDETTFRASLRRSFEHILRTSGEAPLPAPSPESGANTGRLLDVLVVLIPPAAAVLSTLINMIDLWLAGRVVRLSGRLRRPWPDLGETRLPPFTWMLLVAAIAACFLPDLAGILGCIFVATLVVAYAAVGLAALHGITRGMASRGVLLGGTYTALVILGWPALLLAVFGLVDAAIDVRARISRRQRPQNWPKS
jgi:hypothetical protein